DSDFIILFVDSKNYRIWIWIGGNNTVRERFIAIKIAQSVKSRYETGYKITTIDEGNETYEFKAMVGLEEEIEYFIAQNKPSYKGIAEDLELLESSSREKINAKDGLIKLKDEQIKALNDIIKIKDEQLNTLEKILKKKETKIKSLEKAIEKDINK
ncbi:unnamed protein product, partial [marine sediment metagenome]